MALSFDCQETKSNTETLGSNYTLSELRLICTQIKKNICSIKTTTQLTISETPLIEGIDIPQSAADNPVSFRHVVFTVQNRLLYLVQPKHLKLQLSKSFCALEWIWPSKYSKRWLFHTFTILRVMFGETSKCILCSMSWLSPSPIQKVPEFSEAGVPFTMKSQCPVIAVFP